MQWSHNNKTICSKNTRKYHSVFHVARAYPFISRQISHATFATFYFMFLFHFFMFFVHVIVYIPLTLFSFLYTESLLYFSYFELP